MSDFGTTGGAPPREKAEAGAGLVAQQGSELARSAREQAGQVAGEARARAQDLMGQAREQVQGQAREQSRKLAGTMHQLADELRDMSQSTKPDSPAATVVHRLADAGHQVASRLEDRGPEGLLGDLQDFARRRPGVFLAGAALAGFVVARAGKGVSAAGGGGNGHQPQRATVGTAAAPQPQPQPQPQPEGG